MKIAKVLSIALIAGAGACGPALAQSLPGSVELTPGVWTTSEITTVCQAYVFKRVPVGGDNQRQSMMTACVKKAYAREVARQRKRG